MKDAINADQREKLKDLFEAAISLSGAERDEFLLDVVATEHAALEGELRRLISYHDQTGMFLEGVATIPLSAFVGGQLVGRRYRVVRQIGRGGMGEVYEVVDSEIKETIALKTIRRDSTIEDANLLQELQLARKVTHPNVCRVYDIGRHSEPDGDILFLTMELLDGETLATRLKEKGPLDYQTALALCRQVAAGIDSAHECGIIHRDLKPANIMFTTKGRVVITDFGLARQRFARGDSSVTQASRLIGTPAYMAPELLEGGRATTASDIYSLGIILHEVLTGRRPTEVGDGFPPIRDTWKPVIQKALSRDPSQRFQTASELILSLMDSESTPTAQVQRPSLQPRRLAFISDRVAKSISLRTMCIVSVALALLAGAIWSRRFFDVETGSSNQKVVVLPFENLNGPEQENMVKGFTDLLTSRLSEVLSIRVISGTSARQAAGLNLSVPEIAKALGADIVVEGSVQQSAQHVRVSVRLVQASTDSLLWADELENEQSDVLFLEASLALAVARKLSTALTAKEQQRLATPETVSSAAQDAYLKGWTALEKQTHEETVAAIGHFKEAVRLDPKYARAHAMLSHAYWYLGAGLNGLSRAASEQMAREEAESALRYDPDLPRAHAAKAQIHFYFDWNWNSADHEFLSAVALNPSDADGNQQYGWFLAARGRLDEALTHMRRARELDPLSASRRSPVAAVLYYAGRYEEAAKELDEWIQINPGNITAHFGLARVRAAQGRTKDALDQLELAKSNAAYVRAELARVHAQAGNVPSAVAILSELEELRRRSPDQISPDTLAIVYSQLGRTDEALNLIEQAYAERTPGVVWLGVDPRFKPLRNQERFIRVLQQVGLTP